MGVIVEAVPGDEAVSGDEWLVGFMRLTEWILDYFEGAAPRDFCTTVEVRFLPIMRFSCSPFVCGGFKRLASAW